MIKQNYAFEKRQKEIAKKQKKQEKLQQKTAGQHERPEHNETDQSPDEPLTLGPARLDGHAEPNDLVK